MSPDPRPGPAAEASAGYALAPEDFRRLARLVHAESGIRLTEAKQSLVISRLSRRLRSLGLRDFGQYCALVEGAAGAEERGRMISSLTTNVTRFFREEHHFAQLRDRVLPPLIARARAGGRVRLWSAGCSTGEEPYSLAFTLLDLCPESGRLDLRILASDIDPQVIATAEAGRYPAQAAASVPPVLRGRFLRPAGPGDRLVEVADEPRRLICYRQLNLLARWPFRGSFDVIFCRNVVIYFDAPTQDALWQRFAAAMAPGGHLFIGHSERLSPGAGALFRSAGVTSYTRSEAPAGAAAATERAAAPIPSNPGLQLEGDAGWA